MKEVIEELLYEQESHTLDFKSEQYKFIGAEPHEKCELLKDILAFANAWRRTDAYILIGVKENSGGRAEIVGIQESIDDAQLQQFVNQKVQRPINFSYHSIDFENKNIAVIKIGPQERPIYLKNNYGRLKKDTIYIKRGSSTDIASPDEISKMGSAAAEPYSREPNLIFGFADLKNRKTLGNEIEAETKIINITDESSIPDYGTSGSGIYATLLSDYSKNKDYYRELAEFAKQQNYFYPLSFSLYNESNIVSSGINIELFIKNNDNILTIYEEKDLQDLPSSDGLFLRNNINTIIKSSQSTTSLKRVGSDYHAEFFIEKAQPKQTIFYEDYLYVGSTDSTKVKIDFTIYSDNLSNPLTGELQLNLNTETKSISYRNIPRLNK
ncbi:ATP-binding protein [uncultured Desulfuromusa sp.]|uniref:AlbA family DNA-binding domain-containing protein n=1 Tax=uncultured Desulfuromusa sp. TaxID=219183 RepID=UPI002AA6D10A|nr:ATP-binding protein [uncultured Desulfuromusa sp.]